MKRVQDVIFLLAITIAISISACEEIPTAVEINSPNQKSSSLYSQSVECTLVVPRNPLSAKGLATPYRLKGCDEANPDQSAFVQAGIYDPATKEISIYNPLVINDGDQPAAMPVKVRLAKNSVVGIWFGFNGDILRLEGEDGKTLADGHCVDGIEGSPFGQSGACNAIAFFEAAADASVPDLGTALNDQPCPTIRDFSIVDQDQSDNLTTTYIVDSNGRIAQDNAINRRRFGVEFLIDSSLRNRPGTVTRNRPGTIIRNPSDNLVLIRVDEALGCVPFMVPDLTDPGFRTPTTALPLNELSAIATQESPVALIPLGNPMAQVDGQDNFEKMNLLRAIVGQAPDVDASTEQYCRNYLEVGARRIVLDKPYTSAAPSLDPDNSNSLFTFLAVRFNESFGPAENGGLGCTEILNVPEPFNLIYSGDVVSDAELIE